MGTAVSESVLPSALWTHPWASETPEVLRLGLQIPGPCVVDNHFWVLWALSHM